VSDYLLVYRSPSGDFIDNIYDFSRLEYATKENEIGVLQMTFPQELMTPMLDGRLEIYRRVGAGGFNLEFETQWLVRGWSNQKSGNITSTTVKAYSAIELLNRRIIAYPADTPQSSKTSHSDNMMNAIMRENFGSSAIGARNISTYLAVRSDAAQAPIITKAFAWKKIFPVLQEIAEASFNLGTYLCFDVVKLTDMQLEFRTYIGQRGINRGSTSSDALLVSEQNGALSDASLTYDFVNEENYVYCGGKGEGIDRVLAEVENTLRSSSTVLNRKELFRDARNTEEYSRVQDEAKNALNENRPKVIFDGTLVDTNGIVYGVNYNYGDIIIGQYNNVSMDCHVNAVHITVESGKETIDIKLRGETYV
jgi:hypothetical protein